MPVSISRREAFAKGFRRSRKGNLWREWQGLTVTVFRRAGGFHWSIADEYGPRYSPAGYQDQDLALAALWVRLDELQRGISPD
jgi:hypothetical protein